MKFGGTSVGNAERMKTVRDLVLQSAEKEGAVAVVSAMSGITDQLISMGKKAEAGDSQYKMLYDDLYFRHRKTAEEILQPKDREEYLQFLKSQCSSLEDMLNGIFLIRELSPRSLDFITSFGELLSSYLIYLLMRATEPRCQFIDSRYQIKTDSHFTAASVDFAITNDLLKEQIKPENPVYVMGGFIASNGDGVITTLGRGGSDYTGAIVAAAINATELEIWTDVDGVMTADPRKVKRAFSLREMTYEEAMEMSHFGAKVIHPPTIQPALQKKIPIVIKNTFNPSHPGTRILDETNDKQPVKGISSISKIALINVEGSGLVGVTGFAARLFSVLGSAEINIILITQASSEHSICFAIKPEDASKAKKSIEDEFRLEIKAGLVNQIEIQTDLAIVAVIGSHMKLTTGISGRLFGALGKNGINIYAIAQGSSELNISTVIHQHDEAKAVDALHQAFFSQDIKRVNLFITGTGLIGKTLLAQMTKQKDYLLKKHSLEFHIAGIANSRQMRIDANGISSDRWAEILENKGEKADLQNFVDRMIGLNLSNSIFIDNSASDEPVAYYEQVLGHSISIATPNKIANSSSMQSYHQLRETAKNKNVKFFYETNVGAGLPVISTLNDLLRSGDEIIRIDAVISGSLSFIFNNYTGQKSFSDLVMEAKNMGYTEPDPREDLSGMDAARKTLIIAREMGLEMELNDIKVEDILPKSCMQAQGIPAFFEELKKYDDHFDARRQTAEKEGKVLRFIANMQGNEARISLQAIGPENPFYALSGSDNMISFTTGRYHHRPLVVQGPGAGAEVTAAGVFAEIIEISQYLS